MVSKRSRRPGKQLVNVGLMADVEDKPVGRSVEDVVHGERQFDDAEIWTKVAAGFRQGEDQPFANLLRESFQLRDRKLLDVCRRVDGVE